MTILTKTPGGPNRQTSIEEFVLAFCVAAYLISAGLLCSGKISESAWLGATSGVVNVTMSLARGNRKQVFSSTDRLMENEEVNDGGLK